MKWLSGPPADSGAAVVTETAEEARAGAARDYNASGGGDHGQQHISAQQAAQDHVGFKSKAS
jgi:hypothetical protein